MNMIGFDIETTGDKPEYALQSYRVQRAQARIRAASFAVGESTWGVLDPDTATISKILRHSVVTGQYVVGWNIAFDVSFLLASGCDVAKDVAWLDAMLLWKHLTVEPEPDDIPKTKRKSYALEAALQEFMPEYASIKEFTDFHTNDPAELQKLLHRNKMDAYCTLKLCRRFYQQLSDKQRRAALLEARCIPLVAQTYNTGISINTAAAKQLAVELERNKTEAYAALLAVAPEVAEYDLGSSKQLADLLYNQWGIPVTKFTKETAKGGGGNPSTDKEVLYELAFTDSRANLIRCIRESTNNSTKFVGSTLKSVLYNGDGVTRPQAKIFGTYTSRMTYYSKQKATTIKTTNNSSREVKVELPTGVALHQWKRGKTFRRLITPPEGFGLIECDFAGQEFRWMAVASGDEQMLSLCQPGEDAHSYMGAQIACRDYRDLIAAVKSGDKRADSDRKLGKFANLSFQYRIGSKAATSKARVQYELDLDETFIKQIIATYKGSYPGVERYWRTQIANCKHKGYAETFAGRRVQITGTWAGRGAWESESTAINYPIQGTGGDQKYLALAVIRNELAKYDAHFYYELHDGLFFIAPLDKMVQAAHAFKHILSNLPYRVAWGVSLPIQFPVDAKISDTSWGDLHEI